MTQLEIIRGYTKELKDFDLTNTTTSYDLSQYYGIYRVLSDLCRGNKELNDAISEFFAEYKKKSDEHINMLSAKLQDNLKILDKIVI